VDSRDGEHDQINCGPGKDSAAVDRLDTVRNCEKMKR
jgi:hypothetical protein